MYNTNLYIEKNNAAITNAGGSVVVNNSINHSLDIILGISVIVSVLGIIILG
jgi:hypothetical protein